MEPDGLPGPADRKLGRELVGQSSHKCPRKPGEAETAATAPKPATSDQDEASTPSDKDERTADQPAAQAKPGTTSAKKQQPRLTPTQLRTFYPEQHREQLRRICEALAVTEEDLPAFLAEPMAVPLKIGTSKDLSQRYNVQRNRSAPERRNLDAALRGYCGSFPYQHAILSCDTRYSIGMEPAEPITEEARERTIDRLRERAKQRKARREQPPCDVSGS